LGFSKIVEERKELRAGLHGMNDDVSIVITNNDNEFDHRGCEVGADERIALWVFVGTEIELYESIVKGVADSVVGDPVLSGRTMNLHPSVS
jgi:hypothetical protein